MRCDCARARACVRACVCVCVCVLGKTARRDAASRTLNDVVAARVAGRAVAREDRRARLDVAGEGRKGREERRRAERRRGDLLARLDLSGDRTSGAHAIDATSSPRPRRLDGVQGPRNNFSGWPHTA